jgi:hypothetical protein
MSEYVEARYVKYVLRKAQDAEQEVASQVINDLFRDLSSLQTLSNAGQQTLPSIRLLAVSLSRRRSLHAHEWDAANNAAEAWCQSALK